MRCLVKYHGGSCWIWKHYKKHPALWRAKACSVLVIFLVFCRQTFLGCWATIFNILQQHLQYRFIMPLPPWGGDIKRWCTSDVWRHLSVTYVRPKSRTERPRKIKIGTVVAHIRRDSDTTFKVKRSKVNLQGAWAYWPHAQLVTIFMQNASNLANKRWKWKYRVIYNILHENCTPVL